ncbi:hypothetical protein BH11PSE14_BH11PSE14_11310 [soil metagenome]
MSRPRWLQPELGLVLLIPLATVIGGLWTLHLADIDDSADGQAEGARHTAQVQTAEIAPDQEASRLGLRATLRVDPACGCARLQLSDPLAAGNGALQLALVHRLYASRDVELPLTRNGAGWNSARLPASDNGWRLVLTDAARHWRLVGRLEHDAGDTTLVPALPAP